MKNKYDFFFESAKRLILGLSLARKKEDVNIHFNSRNIFNGKKLNLSIESYISHLQTQIEFTNNSLGGAFFNLTSIIECEKKAEKKAIRDKILKVKTIDGWEKKEAAFEDSKILFLKYDALGSSYLFIESGLENPVLYIYWVGGEVTSDSLNFTSFVREIIFWELVRRVETSSSSFDNNINKIVWLKFHEWFLQNSKNGRNKLITYRHEFNKAIIMEEEKNNTLLGIDEFEVEFIKYLIEKKELKKMPEIFDPYSRLVTFEEYLNNQII